MPADAAKQAQRVQGEYEFNRKSYTTFQKAIGLAGDIRISAADSGRLLMHSALGDTRLLPVGPLLYREGARRRAGVVPGGQRWARRAGGLRPGADDDDGARPVWPIGDAPLEILGIGIVVFIGMVLAAIGRLFRRRFGEPRREDVLPGRWTLVTASALQVVFVIATRTAMR